MEDPKVGVFLLFLLLSCLPGWALRSSRPGALAPPFLCGADRACVRVDPRKERRKRLSERKGNKQTRVQGGDAPEWRSRHLQRFVRLSRSFPKSRRLFRKHLSSAKAGVRLGSGLSQRSQHWGCGQKKAHPSSPFPQKSSFHLASEPLRATEASRGLPKGKKCKRLRL